MFPRCPLLCLNIVGGGDHLGAKCTYGSPHKHPAHSIVGKNIATKKGCHYFITQCLRWHLQQLNSLARILQRTQMWTHYTLTSFTCLMILQPRQRPSIPLFFYLILCGIVTNITSFHPIVSSFCPWMGIIICSTMAFFKLP